MKKAVYLVGYLVVGLSLFFLLRNLVVNLKDIPGFEFTYQAVLALVMSTLLCAGTVAILSLAWSLLIRGGNVYLTVRQAYVIMAQSQIGRYLPGNIWHYAGRVALGRRYGVSAEATLLSTSMETVMIFGMGLIISVAGLLFSEQFFPDVRIDFYTRNLAAPIALVIAVFAVIGLAITAVFVVAKPVWTSAKNWIKERLPYIHVGRIGVSGLLYISIFLIFGSVIWLLLNLIWRVEAGISWYQFVWSFSIAWVAGFVTPGAPGGIGVREAILVTLYSPVLGEGLALGLSLMLRVLTSLGDLVAFGLAYYLSQTQNLKSLR
ncbi:flippase-like domain-containing protein [Cyanobacteria bacterium FACHB-471]|nr:flippase-like domain-containing protein [Cyanobacteria bacterium FACHB-471]